MARYLRGKNMRTNRRYFKCYKFVDEQTRIDYWHTANPEHLLSSYDFIQPLGYKKPKLKEWQEIKEG